MKKVVFILAMCFCTILFTGCTDLTEDLQERIENEALVDPSDDGKIKDTDPDDDGEG